MEGGDKKGAGIFFDDPRHLIGHCTLAADRNKPSIPGVAKRRENKFQFLFIFFTSLLLLLLLLLLKI